MKNSYDYFKTLKDISLCVNDAFSRVLRRETVQSAFIKLSGMRSEFSEKLFHEFTAPLQRDDLCVISALLYEEFSQMSCLSDGLLLIDSACAVDFEQGTSLFDKQVRVFELLCDKKHPEKTLKAVSETYNFCNRLRKEVYGKLAERLKFSPQPLQEFLVWDSYIGLLKAVGDTVCETERVVINNN